MKNTFSFNNRKTEILAIVPFHPQRLDRQYMQEYLVLRQFHERECPLDLKHAVRKSLINPQASLRLLDTFRLRLDEVNLRGHIQHLVLKI